MGVIVNLPTPGAHDVWGQKLNVEIQKIADAAGVSSVAGLEGAISAEDLAEAINSFIVAPPGASAYEVWLDAGNTGTVNDYLASLKGATGAKGDPGVQGNPGTPGDTIRIGTVSTVAAGGSATATITGTSPDRILNLGIPRGDKGDKGDTGAGVPAGGAEGAQLIKASAANGDTFWRSRTMIRLSRAGSSPVAVPSGAWTVLSGFDATDYAAGDFSYSSGAVTLLRDGVWMFSGRCAWAGNTAGRRGYGYAYNGTSISDDQIVLPGAGFASALNYPAPVTIAWLPAGTVVRVLLYQDSGAALNTGGLWFAATLLS